MRPSPRAVELLRAVHAQPGSTRADAARGIGLGTGAATEAVGALVEAQLVAEQPAAPTGARGRPTTVLVPHPQGPIVLAVSLTNEDWRIQAVELGGTAVAEVADQHAGRASADVLADLAAAVTRLRRRFAHRVWALSIAAPGTVEGSTIVHAANPTWRDVDLRALWPRAEVLVAGNDATLAAAAEQARGAAVGAEVALHVRVDAGAGGGVVEHGVVQLGAHGLAGEFGHLPFGDPSVRCSCGAYGCWSTAVDGVALARILGERAPADPVAYTRRVLDGAARSERRRAAVEQVAAALGRGVAGLVNALDPDAVTIGGGGADLLAGAGEAVERAYRAGLMQIRRPAAPQLLAAALGEDGPLVGAAEQGWNEIWSLW